MGIPDDGGAYPLPPGLGAFPVLRVDDYADRVPASWREEGAAFIPMYQLYQREALWLQFSGALATARRQGCGREDQRDYRLRLDGTNAGDGYIRQFVAMPLGSGYTVEG